MKRTLSLKREALTALTTDELAAFGGAGSQDPTPPWITPKTLEPKECFATTQDSVLVCSGDCMTYGASCPC